MVERFVEAVLLDGVPVGSILALTFTEKAAGELRERARKRLNDLGEDEHARAVDAAWIGTIHGFCARVLRSRPLAAGLDPRFTVLEEAAAGRLAAAAYERALEAWVAALGRPAVDLAAAYGPGLRDLVFAAHATLRSRGAAPRLAIPAERPTPSPAALAEAHAVAARELEGAGDGIRVSEGRSALAACERALAGAGAAVPSPGELDAAKLGAGAKALATEACEAYRTAWEAYRSGCADHHARKAVILLDELLARFAAEYAEGKADRAAVDFEDLELGVRDLLADEAERRRWSERFALLMVDEFQDTNRAPARPAGGARARRTCSRSATSSSRSTASATPTCRSSASGGRKLDASRVRGLRANFRSAPELLDVLDAAFAPVFGDALPAARGRPPARGRARGRRRRRAAALRPGPAGGRAAGRAARHRLEGLGRARGRGRARRARRAALAAGGGTPGRAPAARGGPRRPPPRRRRRARARHRVAAAVRAGARGAGPADLRRRRPRLLVPGAGPRRPRLPRRAWRTRATRPPSTACSPRRSAAPAATRSCCSPRPAATAPEGHGPRCAPPRARPPRAAAPRRGRRGRVARRRPGRGPRPAAAVRGLLRRRARAGGAAAAGDAARAGDHRDRATTWRSSRGPAASGGWRTCAS